MKVKLAHWDNNNSLYFNKKGEIFIHGEGNYRGQKLMIYTDGFYAKIKRECYTYKNLDYKTSDIKDMVRIAFDFIPPKYIYDKIWKLIKDFLNYGIVNCYESTTYSYEVEI